MDAMQHVRAKLRWEAIDEENKLLKKLKKNIIHKYFLMEIL